MITFQLLEADPSYDVPINLVGTSGLYAGSLVLTIDQVRTVFGLGKPPIDASPMPKQKPDLYLIGHAFEGDFKVLKERGIRLTNLYDVAGIIDTKILIEDLC